MDETPTSHPVLEEDRRSLRSQSLESAALDAMFADVAARTTQRPASWRDRLREASTPVRIVGVGALLVALVAALVLGLGIRPGLAGWTAARFGIVLASVFGLGAAVTVLCLRGFHQRPVGRVVWAAVAVALAVPLVLASIPELWATGISSAHEHAPHSWACMAFGVGTGLIAGGAIFLFQRADRPAGWRLAAAGAAGGLTGFSALQLHCPAESVEHMLLGHASIGVVLGGLALLWAVLRR